MERGRGKERGGDDDRERRGDRGGGGERERGRERGRDDDRVGDGGGVDRSLDRGPRGASERYGGEGASERYKGEGRRAASTDRRNAESEHAADRRDLESGLTRQAGRRGDERDFGRGE